jgi:hypothetical protein
MSGQLDPNVMTLDDIKRLQQMEQSLYSQLEAAGTDITQQGRIMDQIDQLTQMRMNMFKQIHSQFGDYQNDLTGTQKAIASQMALAKVTEAQLDDMKRKVQKLEEMKNDKLRMVEIGNYEAQRYDAYKSVMWYIFLTAIVMVVVHKMSQLGVLPDFLSVGIVSITLIASVITITIKLLDIGSRSPLNFDKYDYSSSDVVQRRQPGYETVIEHDKRAFAKMMYGAETSYDDAKQQLSGYTKSAGDEVKKIYGAYGDSISVFGLNGSVDRVQLQPQSPPALSLSTPTVENFAAF